MEHILNVCSSIEHIWMHSWLPFGSLYCNFNIFFLTAPRMPICPLRQSNICVIEMRSVIFPFDIELHQKSQIFSMWSTGRGGNDRLLAANISKSEQLMPVKKLDDWGRKNVIPSQFNDCIKVNANYVATSNHPYYISLYPRLRFRQDIPNERHIILNRSPN